MFTATLAVCCAGLTPPHTTVRDPAAVDLAQLWAEPADLESKDFRGGPGGAALAPQPGTRFTVIALDRKGYSRGYDVRDAQGVDWSVKLGPEAQPEVVVSRVLWGIGYHQPPTYLLSDWTLDGKDAGPTGVARFRRKDAAQKVVADWSWYENPFVETQAFKGLVVANLILNNWDWKTSNNKIYDAPTAVHGPRRKYVVRDLGASLGKTSLPALLKWTPLRALRQGSRNDVEDFERQGFIMSVDGERVRFHYHGLYGNLVDTVTAGDVVWTCRLLARISDRQWRDAFDAGGYAPEIRDRFVAKVKAKIAEGLALAPRAAAATGP